jgi:hypothetical protein
MDGNPLFSFIDVSRIVGAVKRFGGNGKAHRTFGCVN